MNENRNNLVLEIHRYNIFKELSSISEKLTKRYYRGTLCVTSTREVAPGVENKIVTDLMKFDYEKILLVQEELITNMEFGEF